MNQVSSVANAGIVILFILISLGCILPFLTVLSVSFSDEQSIVRNGYGLWPSQFSLQAWHFLAEDLAQIIRSYGISTLVTAIGTAISLILTALYAYPLSRRDFPYRKAFAMFLFITMLFNGGLVPFYVLYTQYLHLKDNLIALILPYLLSPFYVIIMRTYITSSIPDSVIESAKLDAASELQILVRIILPLSLPVFATVGLFITLMYWNDWFMSLLFISKPENVSIQYYMYKTMRSIQYMLTNSQLASKMANTSIPSESVRMAMAIAGIGPIAFAYPFFQRYFVQGLTIGAIKG